MVAITEMGLPDWEMKEIVAEYRKLVKLDEVLSCTTDTPFIHLISFMEKLLPAFEKELISGDLGNNYETLRELVTSDIDDEKMMNILLCQER